MIEIDYRRKNLVRELLVMGLVRRPEEQKLIAAPRKKEIPGWMSDPRALKVEAYKNKEEFVTEVSRIVLENRKGSEDERISPYDLIFDENGEPNFPYEKETKLGMAEYDGMMNMRQLALNGETNVIWLSVPGGRSGYPEGRGVFGRVKSNKGKVVIECRGIPILKSAEEIKKKADKLKDRGAVQIGGCSLAEDLREQPLGIKTKTKGDFWNLGEQVFGMKEVWEAIRQGKDIQVKDMIESWLGDLWEEMQKKKDTTGITNRRESVIWGKWLEMQIMARGIQMVGGNHGGMNSEIGKNTLFTGLFGRSEIGIKAEMKNGRYTCPCGQVLAEGQTRCPKCGLKINAE